MGELNAGDRHMKKKIRLGVLAIAVIAGFGGKYVYDNFTVEVPNYQPIDTVVWLPQNWTAEQRDWFHHADQGTQTFGIPYEWFIALEQPPFSSTTSGLLSDPLYLDRYGFIPDTTHTDKGELPIGFAHGGQILDISGNSLRNPQTDAEMTSLGFTCAACHTGRLTYQRTTILFDGGPALTNVRNFQKAVGLSIVYTHLMPWRFSRFADRVLGFGASDEAKSNLRKQFDAVYGQVTEVAKLERSVKSKSVDEGFTRLDALSRIGNTVFALDLDHHENFVAYSAPVHFPRIWDASWFEWVQYNGSIQQPMTRNAGEALGVRATVTFPVAKSAPNLKRSSQHAFPTRTTPSWKQAPHRREPVHRPHLAKMAGQNPTPRQHQACLRRRDLVSGALQGLPPAPDFRFRLLDRAPMVAG